MELKAAELLAEWKAGRFRPVYYIFGEEPAAKAEALKALKAAFAGDDFNVSEFSGDPASEAPAALAEAMTLPVLAERRLVVVRAPRLSAEAKAAYADYLRAPSPSTVLVLLCDERRPERKDAFAAAAAAAGAVAVLAPLDPDEAGERLVAQARRAGHELSPEAAEALVAEVGCDWALLAQELEKALLYAGPGRPVGLEAVGACLGLARSAADPWALEKLVQARDLKACLRQLRELFAAGKAEEAVFRSLAQIRGGFLKQLRAKRLLRAGAAQRDIETRLRIFYDRDFFTRAARVSEGRLRRDLARCLETEADLKSKSWLNPRMELERLVVELCAPAARAPRAG